MRVAIEANVGAGKSTLLRALRQAGAAVVLEPVEEWEASGILSLFYQDRARWAFAFQMAVLRSYLAPEYGDAEGLLLCERCPLSCRHVFGSNLFGDGCMTEAEWAVFKAFFQRFAWEPDAIIYVRTEPEECLARVQARSREAEAPISLEFLRKIHRQYENMVRYSSKPVFVVDGGLPPEVLAAEVGKIMSCLAQKTCNTA